MRRSATASTAIAAPVSVPTQVACTWARTPARVSTRGNAASTSADRFDSHYVTGLQFFVYIFVTVWLVQRGSPESKDVEKAGTESDAEQLVGEHARDDSPRWACVSDWCGSLFSRSLGIVMGVVFLLSWLAQSVAGWAAYNSEQLGSRQDPVTWLGYLGEADFWNRTLQNWQSEMLAVGSMAVLAVYLRQRSSPESKPVGAAHADTGETG